MREYGRKSKNIENEEAFKIALFLAEKTPNIIDAEFMNKRMSVGGKLAILNKTIL